MINLALGVSCGWLAVCFFGAYAFTSPKKGRWLKVPLGLRLTFLPTALAFMARSVELVTLEADAAAGAATPAGLATAITLAITVTALLVWACVLNRLEPAAWDRVRWALDQIKQGMVPVMMPPAEVALLATRKPEDNLNAIFTDDELAAQARELAERGEIPALPKVVNLH